MSHIFEVTKSASHFVVVDDDFDNVQVHCFLFLFAMTLHLLREIIHVKYERKQGKTFINIYICIGRYSNS